jgi:phosphoribosylformylglycinamidine cyclo-ligase
MTAAQPPGEPAYTRAGVDIAAGERAVQAIKPWVQKTQRSEVIGGIGGFAGLFDASKIAGLNHPVLATSTDGVGTKVAIAQAMGIQHTIGFDLVGMLVDDVVACGAEPLWVTDYICCGKIVPDRISKIVQGIAEACAMAGCALLGGELAEHPGLLSHDAYDVAGATTGVVEADQMLGPDRVRTGDAVIALAASGLHSNGYSLVRKVLLADAGWSLDREVSELGRRLGDELLEPTRIYARDCLALCGATQVHAVSHITGGGLASNLARVLPPGTAVQVDRSSWQPQPIFNLIAQVGQIPRSDAEATFNQGVGMVAIVAPDDADAVVELLRQRGLDSWPCGTVLPGEDGAPAQVSLAGDHPGRP